jgi:hypothetical protein
VTCGFRKCSQSSVSRFRKSFRLLGKKAVPSRFGKWIGLVDQSPALSSPASAARLDDQPGLGQPADVVVRAVTLAPGHGALVDALDGAGRGC